MKLTVIGSRTFTDYELLEDALDLIDDDITLILYGGVKLAQKYAENHGIKTLQVFSDNNDDSF